MKRMILSALLLALPLLAVAGPPQELTWEELIPPAQQLTALGQGPVLNHSTPAGPQAGLDQVQLNTELSGKRVRLPGFVVPLEGDDKVITEFLLVPYFGACIHVPPPPANQIVHVRFPQGARVDDLWDAIWVEGVLTTTALDLDVAQVGYAMEATAITPYE